MSKPRVLVTGATGFLGPFVVAALRPQADVVTLARSGADFAVDVGQSSALLAAVAAAAPDFVLHLAAMSRMAECERDPVLAQRINAEAAGAIAAQFGARFLYASTDLVFDGRRAPYVASDPTMPLSEYGMSKVAGEQRVLAVGGRVARLPLLFGPDPQGRGATGMIRAAMAQRQPVALFTNEYRTPLHAADAARGLVDTLLQASGDPIVHLPGPERLSRWELGVLLCARHGIARELLVPSECQDPLRPRDVSLRGAWQASRDLAAMLADC